MQIVNVLAFYNNIFDTTSTIFLIISVMLFACLVLFITKLVFNRL